MSLKSYAERVTETRGLNHQVVLRALRVYIRDTREEELIKEIESIYDARILRALWEAGLSSRLQEQVLFQLGQIK